jgi:uncharacterized protein YndB with AHSA1/START domain
MTYELRVERVIDAQPKVVFDAFVDPVTQSSLYDNPEEPDWSVESEVDLRVGGIWTITFGKSGEMAFKETNVFTEVDRPHRLAFDSNMFGGPYATTFDTKVTVTFQERDGKTLLTIVQTEFERREERDMIEGGWPSILDALERVVAQPTGRGSS